MRRRREMRDLAVVARLARADVDLFDVFKDPPPVAAATDEKVERWWSYGSAA